jgi:hypothetical protein
MHGHAGNSDRLAQPDALGLLERFVSANETPDDVLRLRKVCSAFLRAQGRVSIEACLNAPSTPAKFSKAQRDIWLHRAAQTQPPASRHAMAGHLSTELHRFLTRGPWRQWRDDAAPPENATPFQEALFWVCRYGRGGEIGQKQIFRVLQTQKQKQMSLVFLEDTKPG